MARSRLLTRPWNTRQGDQLRQVIEARPPPLDRARGEASVATTLWEADSREPKRSLTTAIDSNRRCTPSGPAGLAGARACRLVAAPRAGAVVRAGAGLRLRLQSVDACSCRSPTRRPSPTSISSAGRTTRSCGPGLSKPTRRRTGTPRSSTWGCSAASMSSSACSSACARDPARPEDPRRRHPAADLSLSAGALVHRHRHGMEAVPRSAHRPREGRARPAAGRASTSTGSSIPRMMIYCVAIAGIWQTSGFVMAMFLAACAASTARS